MSIALDKTQSLDSRITNIINIGRYKDQNALKTIIGILCDEGELQEAQIAAAKALTYLDKIESYHTILEVLRSKDTMRGVERDLREEVLVNAYRLKDSRLLFPLVNRYNSASKGSENDRDESYKILRAIGETKDPRATDFFQEVIGSGNEKAGETAQKELEKCRNNQEFAYTFHGSEAERKEAQESAKYRGLKIILPSDLFSAKARQIFDDEESGGLHYALYVVTPDNLEFPYNGKCTMTIAPRRSEHFIAAKGEDVLTAGQIGVDLKALKIRHLDNQSGGYLPAKSSISWVLKSLRNAGIAAQFSKFTTEWPAEGYLNDAFLQGQPLYRLA